MSSQSWRDWAAEKASAAAEKAASLREPAVERGSSGERGSGRFALPSMDMSAIKSAASDVASWAQEKAASARPTSSPVVQRAAAAPATSSTTARALSPAERAARFEGTLRQSPVPLGRLKAMAFADGVPETRETASLRATTWKLLLGHLPLDRAQWGAHLAEQRALYFEWLKELTVDPQKAAAAKAAKAADDAAAEAAAAAGEPPSPAGPSDHPLALESTSVWKEWFVDEELRSEIAKDIDRTLPDYAFFNREQDSGKANHAAISRVLFVYAKLNPGSRHVAGRA